MNRPFIGVMVRKEEKEFYINESIWNAVIKYGGIPLLIVPICESTPNMLNYEYSNEEVEIYNKLLSMCSGFILPGGDDYYNIDMYVVEYAYKNDKPLLGICLGMQTIAVWDSKIDIVEMENTKHKSSDYYVHKVEISGNSMLYKILNSSMINVNSRHSFKVVELDKLNIGARSDDGIIEEIEALDKKFFIGVQWHPEDIDDDYSKGLFKKFIDSCL